MAARYRGTCIGGVADGHWIERDDPNITVTAQQNLVNVEQPGAQIKILQGTDYRFLLLLGTNNAEIGVWCPQDVSVEQVVTRLVKCYNPRTGLIGTPAPNALPIKTQ